jgi:hypothetical protein
MRRREFIGLLGGRDPFDDPARRFDLMLDAFAGVAPIYRSGRWQCA